MHLLHNRNSESRRFTSTGLGDGQHIVTPQNMGDGLVLNVRRARKTFALDVLLDLGGEGVFVEFHLVKVGRKNLCIEVCTLPTAAELKELRGGSIKERRKVCLPYKTGSSKPLDPVSALLCQLTPHHRFLVIDALLVHRPQVSFHKVRAKTLSASLPGCLVNEFLPTVRLKNGDVVLLFVLTYLFSQPHPTTEHADHVLVDLVDLAAEFRQVDR